MDTEFGVLLLLAVISFQILICFLALKGQLDEIQEQQARTCIFKQNAEQEEKEDYADRS